MTDNHKILKDITGQEINETLKAIKNVLAGGKNKGYIYGFYIDANESDPEDRVTYLKDAVGMTPAYMDYTNGVFNYGSWKDAFFMPRPCMLNYDGEVDYYLDPDDYSKKIDGTPSDVADETYAGNAMMEWGRGGSKIWYKIVPDTPTVSESASIYIADHQVDEGFNAWSFLNNQRVYVDHFYTPIYNGYYDGTRMRSISGKTPTASLNAATERTYCQANNTTLPIWDTEVYCDIILINFLLILISKSTDSQSAFGQGNTTSGQSGVLNTGTMDDKGMFYGYSTTTSGVKVFGMENWWGNLWRRFAGLINDNGIGKFKLTRSTLDGSGVSDYVVSNSSSDYSGYLVGTAIPESGWVKNFSFSEKQFIPSTVEGSSSTYYADYFYSNNGQVDYAIRGGRAVNGSSCGSCYFRLDNASSASYWDVAAAPSCKPIE